jgi:hypothetical protein
MDKTNSYLIVMLSLSVSCFYAPIFIGAFFCLNFTQNTEGIFLPVKGDHRAIKNLI